MKRFASILSNFPGFTRGLSLGLFLAGTMARAEDEKPANAAREGAQAAVAADEEAPVPPRIQGLEMLPEGKTNLGVRLPVFEGAKQTMLFKAAEMTPKNKDELDMKVVEIRILNDEGAEDTKIVMSSSRYLVSAGLLTSDEQTVIHGVDYTLTGASMDFNTEKKYGVMRGPVKMILRDINKFTAGKEEGKVTDVKAGTDDAAPSETRKPAIDTNDETISPNPEKQ